MKKPFLFFIFLFLISCLGQISSDVYLPALPTIQNAFHTTEHWMQLSLAIYMFGFSVSHLCYGPISDHVGRRKPLIIGISVCILGSLLCRFASNVDTFVTGRFLQGFGAGAGAVLFLSIMRDAYSGNRLAKISSFLGLSRVVLLACAPLIGSYLLRFFSWRACFTFLLIYAVICLMGSIFMYKETHVNINLAVTHIRYGFKNTWHLLTHSVFLSYTFSVMLAFGGILAWLTTLPFLLQNNVGLTSIQFGWVSAISGLFFIVGGLINALTVERFGFHKMLLIGLSVMFSGSVVMLIFGLIGKIDTLVIMIPVVIYIIGSSFVFSNAYTGAMHSFSEMAGTAGAIYGFLQILGGAVSSLLMSYMHNYNQTPLAIVLLCSALLAFMILKFFAQSETATQS
ncbi:MAG: multidrug effflux MFS transporter [Gammaproteobacteria bacterium]|nr:multidrug effflux MFS transporter [Gammaproteobacteria bacterium]